MALAQDNSVGQGVLATVAAVMSGKGAEAGAVMDLFRPDGCTAGRTTARSVEEGRGDIAMAVLGADVVAE